MTDRPVKSLSPPEDPIGQFGKKTSVERSEVPVSFEGISEEAIGMAIRFFQLIQKFKTDRPRGLLSQNLPVLAISSSLVIRSPMGG